jgi:hypothetical protein
LQRLGPESSQRRIDERAVEAHIMRHENRILHETPHLRQRFGQFGRGIDHFVRDARQTRNLGGNELSGIHERAEAIDNGAITYAYQGYFRQSVSFWMKSRRFDIADDEIGVGYLIPKNIHIVEYAAGRRVNGARQTTS